MKRLSLLVSLSLATCLLLAGCGGYDQESWTQKVVIEVETPQGLVTGASVQQVNYSKANFKVYDGADTSFRVTGEAVVVDLGPSGKLFALLKGETYMGNAGMLSLMAFSEAKPGFASPENVQALVSKPVGSTAELPPEGYQLLVTFTDIDDPKTVKKVDPNNLAATFGPGVRLKSITLEITDEPVTEGSVEDVLGWWCDYRKRRARLNGSTSIAISNNELSNNLGTGSFKIGDCR